jgi:hypothetical protein
LPLATVQTPRRPFKFTHTTVSFLLDHPIELPHRFQRFAFPPCGCVDRFPGCPFGATNFFGDRTPLDLAVAHRLLRLPVGPPCLLVEGE